MARQIAYKIAIKDVKEGSFIENDDEPNFLSTKLGNISRCNLMGLVIATNINNQSFILDDGSSPIEIKQFEEKINLKNLEIGSVVQIIGRPRVYENNIYVVAEIVKELNKEWLQLRKKELETQKIIPTIYKDKINFPNKTQSTIKNKKLEKKNEEVIKITKETVEEKPIIKKEIVKEKIKPIEELNEEAPKIKEDSEINKPTQILNKIKELDTGEGANIDDVAESFDYDADIIITNLLSEGEIYEIKPGKIKVLE